jgi:very-short-patch-repair endonuclease
MGPFLESDRRIAALAAAQEGVVRHDQLRELGLTPKAIRSRREARRLIVLHRAVYAVGHTRLSVGGRRLAAAWAYGPKAVLSHRTAAAVWDLRASGGGDLHVTVPARSAVVREGTRLHLTSRPVEVDRVGLLPVTTVARTMLDLAGDVAPHAVEAALKEADVLGLFDLKALRAAVAAHPRHPGARVLAGLLDAAARTELALTLSELEVRFRRLCDEHALPQPAVNARPLGFRVDFYWPDAGLVVETDGWRAHRTRAAFEEDRARDQELALAGLRTVRFTHRQIVDGPREVAERLRRLLGG